VLRREAAIRSDVELGDRAVRPSPVGTVAGERGVRAPPGCATEYCEIRSSPRFTAYAHAPSGLTATATGSSPAATAAEAMGTSVPSAPIENWSTASSLPEGT
jgi:hypothetical protein